MTLQHAELASIDAADLADVSGGGLFGAAFRIAKDAYEVAKPIVKDVAKEVKPFAYVAYKAHSIWNRFEQSQSQPSQPRYK